MTDSVSTSEVQARFVDHYAKHARAHKNVAQAVFQEWYASELRKAKAEALREAAEGLKSAAWSSRQALNEPWGWLRDRADRIEGGGDD